MIRTHVLGFPRIGAQRELKRALEAYWRGQIDAGALEECGRALRARHWALQREAGLDCVCVGDFAFYDHVANHIQLFGCEPSRFGFSDADSGLVRTFTMARGVAREIGTGHGACSASGRGALEMSKWFDTNYHYLVPEFGPQTAFRLAAERLLGEVDEALALGHPVKTVLLGPLSFLYLGKSLEEGFERLDLLDSLLPVYRQLLGQLKARGVAWVQLDEPILGLDLPDAWRHAFEPAYHRLQVPGLPVLLATYFSPLAENAHLACRLPVAALHLDLVRGDEDLQSVLQWLPEHRELSLGILDGRNIWRCDLDAALDRLSALRERRGGTLWLAPSCSLLHVPLTLADDEALDAELRPWVAGAVEKLTELELLRSALSGGEAAAKVLPAFDEAREVRARRALSSRVSKKAVAARINALAPDDYRRASPFSVRQRLQRERFNLPLFPTTTIGSFPQTESIRATRAALRRGALSDGDYRSAIRNEIASAVREQEALGLDVLVHGEAERNDMVEYFGGQLEGFAFTANGWVQSYGSRCVKPPILFGDVERPRAMTVEWSRYAQSLTARPVKGMLTGPVTILQWSFVRDDVPRSLCAQQIALAIRDEVGDLEAAGLGMIQIDEPALREGLPLRRAHWRDYLAWATRTFRLSVSGVADSTQIHTHMCYAEFGDILEAITAMDADVITLEASRSGMTLLRDFADFRYPNEIGPGVYDIHSPVVPAQAQVEALVRKAAEVVPARNIWVNPDCGLKTRAWPETRAALSSMVAAARALRQEFA
ncbi:5-methyltetrahydropteroyltriglutamate--homocysteine S-methyltransferase [Niveibacterium terrae]|uniref:5-methyltetrahydropteroyltriglutamate-- homocysteine S-methyltransferase n=1 Tax=Niveibacterium terrae TaxID=3373598 RepID=UPI003A9182FE